MRCVLAVYPTLITDSIIVLCMYCICLLFNLHYYIIIVIIVCVYYYVSLGEHTFHWDLANANKESITGVSHSAIGNGANASLLALTLVLRFEPYWKQIL